MKYETLMIVVFCFLMGCGLFGLLVFSLCGRLKPKPARKLWWK